MKISSTSAQQIVEEIGKLVRQNINLMDETGHIIASNDPSRIGTFHPGAYEIITSHLNELYITREMEQADALLRQGINLPIQVDGQVEGVIGITGLYDEVIQYGQIVKKMAEILVKERIAMDEQRLDLRIRTRFLEEWILGEGLSNLQSLSDRGYALGINISKPRRCVVISPRTWSSISTRWKARRSWSGWSRWFPPCCPRSAQHRTADSGAAQPLRSGDDPAVQPSDGGCPQSAGGATGLRHRRQGTQYPRGLSAGQPRLALR